MCMVAVVGGSVLFGLSANPVAGDRVSMQRAVVGDSPNGRTTRRYLEAARTALIAMVDDGRQVDHAIGQLVQVARSGCAGVAAGGVGGRDSWLIEVGITESLAVAAAHAYSAIDSRFRDKVKMLRWTNVRLTARVQRSADAEMLQSRQKSPRLCGYVRGWAHSRFEHVPGALIVFSREVADLSEMSALLPSALRKDEGTTLAEKAREVARLERVVAIGLRASILRGRVQILTVIGLVRRKRVTRGAALAEREGLPART